MDGSIQAGYVHRDVKPLNYLVKDQSHIWINDFGLSVLETNIPKDEFAGTPGYMPSELAHVSHHRYDSFSLGITLGEMGFADLFPEMTYALAEWTHTKRATPLLAMREIETKIYQLSSWDPQLSRIESSIDANNKYLRAIDNHLRMLLNALNLVRKIFWIGFYFHVCFLCHCAF